MANFVSFKKGLLSALPAEKTAGTFYVTTDDHSLHLDVDASTRIRLGDVELVASISALPAVTAAVKGKFYYAETENVFCFPKDGVWQQVNPDTGATSVEVVGSGNAVTAASYDAATRKLTLTKDETFATKGELEALDDKVGVIPSSYTESNVIAYVDKKAEEVLAAAQGGSSETAASVKAALDSYKNATDPRLESLEADTHTHANKAELDKIAEGDKAKWDAAEQNAKTYADGLKEAEVARAQAAEKAAQDAADAAQADVDALEAKVGTVTAGKTVVEMIQDAQAAATYDDTALAGRVTTAEGKISTLVGEDANKSARAIAAEETAKIVAGADTAYDTLKEIADWISSHTTDAASMNSAIVALQAIVDGIGGEGEEATVVAYVDAAIDALSIGDYAKAADLTALAARVSTLEGKAHEHANKTVLDGITATKVSAWDTAEQNAKTYADGLADNYDVAGSASTAEANAKAYADSLAPNYDVSGSADAALSSAKTYADGKDTAMDARVKVLEAIDHDAYMAYADTAEADAVSAAKTYTDGLLTWGEF